MLRGNRDFQLYFVGQIFSMVAGSSAALALPLLVYLSTGSAVQAGLVGSVTLAVYAISMLPIGTLSDRLPAKAALVGSDAARGVLAAIFTLAVLFDYLPMWLILGYAILESVLATLFRASGPGSIKRLVRGDQLVTAASWFQARNALAGVAGPAVGGALLALNWAAPFAVKAVAHGISVGTLLAIRTPLPGATKLAGGVPRQLFAGLAFLWRDRFLRSALIGAGCVNLIFGAVHSMVTLGSAEEGFQMEEIGLLMALAAAGALIGAAVAPQLSRALTPRQVFVLVLGGGAVAVASMALTSNPLVLALLFTGCMILPPVVTVIVTTARVHRAPDELQGRATTATMLFAMGLSALGPLLSGFIVENTESGQGFTAYGVLLGVLAVAAMLDRGLGTYVLPGPVTSATDDRPAERVAS